MLQLKIVRVIKQRVVTRPIRALWDSLGPEPYRTRIAFALFVSLWIHALVIALRFGAPGFGLPWFDEPVQGPPLSLRMADELRLPESPTAAAPAGREPRAPIAAAKPAAPATPPRVVTSLEVRLAPAPAPAPAAAPAADPQREARAPAPAAKARAREKKVRPKPAPQILAQRKPQPDTFKVPRPKRAAPEPQRAPETVAKKQIDEARAAEQALEQARREAGEIARLEAEEAARLRAEEEARSRALAAAKELEAKKLAEARRQAELEARKLAEDKARQEAEELARQPAIALAKEQEARKLEELKRLELEARKLEEAKRLELEAKKLEEAKRLELARKEEEARKLAELEKEEAKREADLRKQEEAKRIAMEAERLKRAEEAARQAEARRKEQEARRQAEEAARAKEVADRKREEEQAAAQRERDRLGGQPAPTAPPAPGAPSGLDIAKKALEDIRTPGSPRGDPRLPQSPDARVDRPRRRSLIGVERDVSLRMYVDGWRWKIERMGSLNFRRSATLRAHDNPIVTVAIRSDGSLEEVYINRSSGVREIDEAVRRIARLNAPYSPFPPDLARQYDVIEIRRVWFFDNTLRILDEL